MTKPTHFVGPNGCPYCGYPSNSATSPFSKARPLPNDLSICLHCAKIARFDQQLALIRCPDDYLKSLPFRVRVQLRLTQIAIRLQSRDPQSRA